jgi:3-hydroxyacyl-[acyl-carrier-protein] dehydratase
VSEGPPRAFPLAAISEREGGWRCRVVVPLAHPCFEGHFEGSPILPAIAQISLVLEALAELTGRATDLAAIPALRLRAPVLPGDELELSVDTPDPRGRLAFELRKRETLVSQGSFVVTSRG